MSTQTTRTLRADRSHGPHRSSRSVRSIAGLAAAGALAFTLAACGGDDSTSEPAGDGGPVSVTPAAPPTAGGPATDASTAGATSPGGATSRSVADDEARNAAAVTAIATAEKAAGGKAYEIDDENDDQSWEVDVMVGDRSVEVKVSGDGRTVQGQTDDDDADDSDKARLARSKTTLVQGIEAALAEVPGALDDVDLDDENGVDVWKVTVDAADNDDVEVYVATDDLRIVKTDR